MKKTTCPFCRCTLSTKIPNWEIIKRLPKPTVPIIFYQIEIKLDSLRKTSTEFNEYIIDFYNGYRSYFDKLKTISESNCDTIHETSLIKNKSNGLSTPKVETEQANVVTATITKFSRNQTFQWQKKEDSSLVNLNSNKNNFCEKLAFLEKKLNNYNQDNVEIGFNLKKKVEKFKSDLNQDENKFNEDNLKKLKKYIDNVNKSIGEKLNALKKEYEKIQNLFSSNFNDSNNSNKLNSVEFLNQIDAILEQESKKHESTSLAHLNTLLATNVIRPISNTTSADNNETNTENLESLRCTTSQKGKFNASLF